MTDDGQVVGDEQICKSTVVAQISEQIEHLGLYRYIQSRNRLIQDHEFWFHRQCAGNAHSLSLAAGELVRVTIHV